MTDTVIRIFRSDFVVLLRILTKPAIAVIPFLILSALIGSWWTGKPPYVAITFLAIGFAVVGLFLYAAVLAYPVKLLSGGIRCYDVSGRYQSIKWSDITEVHLMNVAGLKYLAIHASTISQPMTLPLWLVDMETFTSMVESQTDRHHKLVQALRADAT